MKEKFTKLYETDLYKERWTNNNSESLNNVLKQEIDWKPKKTEALVNKLRDIVDRKILDLKSSLHAVGNWSLTSEYRRYAINNSKWNSMGSDWQKKELN